MPISIDQNMMREIIMDHYKDPENKEEPNDKKDYIHIRMDSTSCIDDITIYLKMDNGVISDVKFDGVGCAISTSSTDIMCNLVKGKTKEEAFKIIENYLNMIYEKPYNEELLDEANAFKNTHKQAARIKCATIGWNGLTKLLNGEKDED
ncbi:MAG: SUF system NifU family Fe-S cluster assembly protein [Firmicutes bacterium]|uniref:SUF system NifU family Fe-S cluster assembly protein n=1 Tax=Candidatus Onthovivens merdipullorum TaxID=2840889 RepID=A0A9D9GXA0_9BACL|nr:SUF system NifU family Fe-S cluster assembly protein [Candidatus Onthovivens merdipullorum]